MLHSVFDCKGRKESRVHIILSLCTGSPIHLFWLLVILGEVAKCKISIFRLDYFPLVTHRVIMVMNRVQSHFFPSSYDFQYDVSAPFVSAQTTQFEI